MAEVTQTASVISGCPRCSYNGVWAVSGDNPDKGIQWVLCEPCRDALRDIYGEKEYPKREVGADA